MDYLKTYKSFIHSQYLSEGVRITAGVLLPAFILSYFNMLPTGISISLGALFVSVTDSAGPVHHRQNGMMVGIASITIVTLIAGSIANSPVLLGIFIFIACFFFSMINIYGTRAGSVGTATLIILTLSIDTRLNLTTPALVIRHSLLIASGGLWYMCFSMLLYNVRPYRLAQQALGDYIQATAQYLLTRSELYSRGVNYKNTFLDLLQQQSVVQHKQTELSELLFKTRSIVKETTNIGRTLVMIHLEVADIFERIMISHQEYLQLHQYFDETAILNDYHLLAKNLAKELNAIGIAVKSGASYSSHSNIARQITNARKELNNLRETYLKPDNIDGFISLIQILENIQDLYDRLLTLQKYTHYETSSGKIRISETGYKKLISSQEISPGLFIDNLTLRSDTFRYSLRVSIAVLAGFILSDFLKIGHSYWVLLTIIVILKPAFSLTRERNRNRIAGTLAGILIGILILFITENNSVLLILLILFMAGSYTFFRTNYFISVLLMTPYLVLFYHFLYPADFKILLKDRIIDTLIGSAIAFLASNFIFPLWEREKIKPIMAEMLAEVKQYFSVIAGAFSGNTTASSVTQQVARKNALVALANLSDAFNRMSSEPKTQQKGVESLHHFVVLNHKLTSYIAALSYYTQMQSIPHKSDDFIKVTDDILQYFTNAAGYLNNEEVTDKTVAYKDSLRMLNNEVNVLLEKRKHELEEGLLETSTIRPLTDLKSVVDQFKLIYNAAMEINKTAKKMTAEYSGD